MAMLDKAEINLLAFLFGGTLSLYPFLSKWLLEDLSEEVNLFNVYIFALVHFVLVNIGCYAMIKKRFAYKIAVMAGNLGIVFAIGFLVCLYSVEWHYLGR